MIDSLKSNYDAYAFSGAVPQDFETANQAFQARYRTGVHKTSDDLQSDATSLVDAQNQVSAGVAGSSGVLGQFGTMLKDEISRVNQLQLNSNENIQEYATGGDIPLHQVMLSVNKAEISLKLATQVRNKLVSAYQEIAHMQI